MNFCGEVAISVPGLCVAVCQLEDDDTDLTIDITLGDDDDDDTFSNLCRALPADSTLAECADYVAAVMGLLLEAIDGVPGDAFSTRQLEKLMVEMAWKPATAIRRREGLQPLIDAFRQSMSYAAV